MKVSSIALLPALASFASANHPLIRPLTNSKASSELQTSRRLDNDDGDISWMKDYTIKYENCLAEHRLVSYRLCPKENSCKKGCSGGGQYLVDFDVFIDAFTEAQLGAREYACEMVRENCENDDENECYEAEGYDYCIDKNDDEFDLQDYLQCAQYDDDFYVGPYCSADDATSIYLGLFTDEGCTVHSKTAFYDYFGYQLPYLYKSIFEKNQCAKCKEHGKDEDQAYGDQEDDDDVLEQCEELYEEADKCEEEVDISNGDVSSCTYIEELIEEEVEVVQASSTGSNGDNWWHGTGPLWIALAVTVALVCTMQCCLLHEVRKRDKKTGTSENLLP